MNWRGVLRLGLPLLLLAAVLAGAPASARETARDGPNDATPRNVPVAAQSGAPHAVIPQVGAGIETRPLQRPGGSGLGRADVSAEARQERDLLGRQLVPKLRETPRRRPTSPAAPAPSGGVSGSYTATATWCAPTPTRCTDWGGEALLAAVHSFTAGDDPYLVTVSRGSRSVVVTVVSFCACRGTDRAIDLSPYAFRQLAPLSRGRIDVVVTDYQLPRTDADLRMMEEVRGDELYR